ncbi:MAG: hypothetical protein WC342_07685 [Methanoregula sp.]|jgi:hypothetical protein
MKPFRFGLAALLFFAAFTIMPAAGGSNDTWDPSYYLTHADTLAGQKDMSRYNPKIVPEPVHTMDPETALLYPNVTACGKKGCLKPVACPFPFLRCRGSRTITVVYTTNKSRQVFDGPTVDTGIAGEILSGPANPYRGGIPDVLLEPGFIKRVSP